MKVTVAGIEFEGTPEEIREFLHGAPKESNIDEIRIKRIDNESVDTSISPFVQPEVLAKIFEFDVIFKDGGHMECEFEIPYGMFEELMKQGETVESILWKKLEGGL